MSMSVLDIQVSCFSNIYDTSGTGLNKPKNTSTIGLLFRCIEVGGKTGTIKENVLRLRRETDKARRGQIKNSLPVITWQGIFNRRSDDGLAALSSLICIDIDHRTHDELVAIKGQLVTWNFVLAFFRSPSGDGLKVIIKTDLQDPKHYKNCYRQLEKIFSDAFGITPDSNCEPLSQGCFLSYDPDIYVNEHVQDWQFHYDPSMDNQRNTPNNTFSSNGGYQQPAPPNPCQQFMNYLNTVSNGMSDEKIIEILDVKFSRFQDNYKDGNRTRSIFIQASTLCKAGIKEEVAILYLKSRFAPTGYNMNKLVYEAKKAYSKNTLQFGSERGSYLNYGNYKKRRQK